MLCCSSFVGAEEFQYALSADYRQVSVSKGDRFDSGDYWLDQEYRVWDIDGRYYFNPVASSRSPFDVAAISQRASSFSLQHHGLRFETRSSFSGYSDKSSSANYAELELYLPNTPVYLEVRHGGAEAGSRSTSYTLGLYSDSARLTTSFLEGGDYNNNLQFQYLANQVDTAWLFNASLSEGSFGSNRSVIGIDRYFTKKFSLGMTVSGYQLEKQVQSYRLSSTYYFTSNMHVSFSLDWQEDSDGANLACGVRF